MFKKIIDKIELKSIAHTISKKKPNTVYYYNPAGKIYCEKDYLLDGGMRSFYNEKGQETAYVHLHKGKISVCAEYEYKEDGSYKRIRRRRFDVINNVRFMKSECITLFNDDKTYTVIENGISTNYDAEKTTEIKDEHGNIIESSTIYPDEDHGDIYTRNTYDENNNRIYHEYTCKHGNKVTAFHRDINEYDKLNRCIKHIFYMARNENESESITLTYTTYDSKNRVIHKREYSNFYYPNTGKQNNKTDHYYRYDEKNNADISYSDYGHWESKSYTKTDILPDGRKIEARWDVPTWIDKVRKFFNAF
jgi:hypothetical protein